MAGRIKGITVEIGGDTSKLSDALKGVNKEIKNTQSQLKDVEKLLKLDPGIFGSILAIDMGGFQLQLNAVRRETLLAAREHPEQYRDLIVRVGGFSAYFTKLSPEMQQEIIDRNEHTL